MKYALVVGIDRYRRESGIPDLKYPGPDADELAEALQTCGFETGAALRNEQATSARIIRRLARLEKIIKPDDLFLFAFFGHGVDQYVLTAGANRDFRTSWLHLDTLMSDLRRWRMRDLVVVLDVCRDEPGDMPAAKRSGQSRGLRTRDLEKVPRDERTPNTFVIYSCAEDEKAHEWSEYGHSIFAKHLLDGIRNETADARQGISGWRDGLLRCDVLADEVRSAVIDDATRLNFAQNPEVRRSSYPIIFAGEGEQEESEANEEREQDQASPRRISGGAGRWTAWSLSGLVAALAFVIAIGVFMGSGPWIRSAEPEFPCSAGLPPGMNLVLMHTPSRLPDSVQNRVAGLLENAALSTVENGLLELRLADGVSAGGRILFSGCRPRSAIGDPTASARGSYSRWLADFKAAVRNGLVPAVTAPAAPPASLMTTIKQIVEQRSWAGRGERVSLFIASNLVENSDAYSYRKDALSFKEFSSTEAYYKFRTDLLRAKVKLYYLRDESNFDLEPQKQITFWSDWFEDARAGDFTLETIEAAQK
jgi:hypothetical protein